MSGALAEAAAGHALGLRDFDGDCATDLLVGASNDSLGADQSGAACVVPGLP